MDVAVAQGRAADAQVQGLGHGEGAAAVEQGRGLVVAQDARRQMQQEFVGKARFQQGKGQMPTAFAKHVGTVQFLVQHVEHGREVRAAALSGTQGQHAHAIWRRAWAAVEAAAAGEQRKTA